ncbi:hypothetical protein [Carbonactinospora thermoautotrophica]|uniref:hypothetical protein n=1 Tax=Carbonactinospora thermoautotrophica TaxID=1469144 RepID=UPI00130109F1|nr:hypothetical protein [Carbonactinospora thermoautotrophica]
MADALKASPVYVSDHLERFAPPGETGQVFDEIRKMGFPTYVAVVPLFEKTTPEPPAGPAGAAQPQATDGEQRVARFANALHDELGRDGLYVVIDQDGRLAARAYGVNVDVPVAEQAAAGLTPRNATAGSRAVTFLRVVRSGRAAELATQARQADELPTAPDDEESWVGPLAITGFLGVGLIVFAGLSYREKIAALLRRVSVTMNGGPVNGVASAKAPGKKIMPVMLSPSEEQLREWTEPELNALSSAVASLAARSVHPDAEPARDLAFQAQAAARNLMNDAASREELVGVLVLAELGQDAARAALRGERAYRPIRPCFFNPLHGRSTTSVKWTLAQGVVKDVPACDQCAEAVKEAKEPGVFLVREEDRAVPYYTRDDLWGETGYGSLREDLVKRVLRGDHKRTSGVGQ